MTSTEIYFSSDIESDGPIPGVYSMLSVGVAAFLEDGTMIDTFYVNLDTLPGAIQDPSTMEFWARNPEAWEACRKDTVPAEAGTKRLVEWVKAVSKKHNGQPVFVGYPASFDFSFVHWYNVRFCGTDPFGFSALDMKSYAMRILNTKFRETTKKRMPKAWFDDSPHTHIALDDAIEQGRLFISMLKAENAKPRP